MKQCTKCHQNKSLDNFTKNSGNKSGIHSWCKECMTNKVLQYRGGRVFEKLQATETHKQCRLCKEMKPWLEYSSKDGKSKQKESYCIQCKKFMGTERVLKKYGLNVDTYMAIYNSQNGVCLICKNPEHSNKRLAVDHDHSCCSGASSCGKCIRGLLCSRCNKTLGMVQDNIEYLQNMIKYLQKY